MTQSTLTALIEQWLDGVIGDEDLADLKKELSSNRQSLELYVDMAEIHSFLAQAQNPQSGQGHIVPVERIIRRQKRRSVRIAAFAAAAVVLIALVTMRLFFVADDPPILTFETSPGTQFTLTHDGLTEGPEGAVLEKGSRLQLSQGTVELIFESGVKSIIMAPADMTLHDDDTLFINKGTAWFQVPQQAIGFNVKTRELDIVDLGTEFGVVAHTDEHDEVHVLKGKVQVTALRLRKETAILTAGHARRIDPVGRLSTITTKPSAFLTSLPDSLPHIYWSFDKGDGLKAAGSHPSVTSIAPTGHPENDPPSYQQGKQGDCISFNGGRQYLSTNWTGWAKNRPRTVSFWLKLPKEGSYTRFSGILGWGDNTFGNSKWKILTAQDSKKGKTYLRLSWGVTWVDGETDLARDQWHHIAVTSSGEADQLGRPTAEIYINGKRETVRYRGQFAPLKTPSMNTSTHTRSAIPLVFGKGLHKSNNGFSHYFQGKIDELYIFDGHMDESEILQLIHP